MNSTAGFSARAHRAPGLVTAARVVLALMAAALPAATLAGCGSRYHYSEPAYLAPVQKGTALAGFDLDPALEARIMALDPDHVSDRDVSEVLSKAPAPRIINIHGGVFPVYLAMESFSKFLIAMGYPEGRTRNPHNGAYSYSCYDLSTRITGITAWHYEREGMRPIIVSHSQGGMQMMKVLYQMAGKSGDSVRVWNPVTDKREVRDYIIDPFTGEKRPVTRLQVAYATAVGTGGITRFIPNQWTISGSRLRHVPDSVEEFTGFYIRGDLLGGDGFGFGDANLYKASGTARVRSVLLPSGHEHVTAPRTKGLAHHKDIREWISNYVQTDEPKAPGKFSSPAPNVVWAADVWTSIKRHWVLELQHMIQARRQAAHKAESAPAILATRETPNAN